MSIPSARRRERLPPCPARGKVRIFSEGYLNAWQAPLIAEDPSLRSAFLQARYNLRPGLHTRFAGTQSPQNLLVAQVSAVF